MSTATNQNVVPEACGVPRCEYRSTERDKYQWHIDFARHMQKNHCSWERTKGGDFICCWINCTFRSTSGGQAMLDHLIIDHVKFSGQSLHRFCVCGGFFKPADESAHRKTCSMHSTKVGGSFAWKRMKCDWEGCKYITPKHRMPERELATHAVRVHVKHEAPGLPGVYNFTCWWGKSCGAMFQDAAKLADHLARVHAGFLDMPVCLCGAAVSKAKWEEHQKSGRCPVNSRKRISPGGAPLSPANKRSRPVGGEGLHRTDTGGMTFRSRNEMDLKDAKKQWPSQILQPSDGRVDAPDFNRSPRHGVHQHQDGFVVSDIPDHPTLHGDEMSSLSNLSQQHLRGHLPPVPTISSLLPPPLSPVRANNKVTYTISSSPEYDPMDMDMNPSEMGQALVRGQIEDCSAGGSTILRAAPSPAPIASIVPAPVASFVRVPVLDQMSHQSPEVIAKPSNLPSLSLHLAQAAQAAGRTQVADVVENAQAVRAVQPEKPAQLADDTEEAEKAKEDLKKLADNLMALSMTIRNAMIALPGSYIEGLSEELKNDWLLEDMNVMIKGVMAMHQHGGDENWAKGSRWTKKGKAAENRSGGREERAS